MFEKQAREIQSVLKATGLTAEELAAKVSIKPDSLRKIAKGYQPASERLMNLIRRLAVPDETLPVKRVPVISWASAGSAMTYEEIPMEWCDFAYVANCPDVNAFAVKLEGDSMEPRYFAGDIAVAMPSTEPRMDCLVIAKLKNDGIVFKRYQATPRKIILSSYNPMYPPMELKKDDLVWIYPVFSVNKKAW